MSPATSQVGLTQALARMTTETWNVGEEYDQSAFDRLGKALRTLGYIQGTHHWAVGGSQEISEWTVRGPNGNLDIAAETYIGLQVTGPIELVRELQIAYQSGSAR